MDRGAIGGGWLRLTPNRKLAEGVTGGELSPVNPGTGAGDGGILISGTTALFSTTDEFIGGMVWGVC